MTATRIVEVLEQALPVNLSGDRGASAALAILVALVVLSPWPMGGAPPWAARTLTVVALAASALVLGLQTLKGRVAFPPKVYWPLYGLVGLGAAQLVPMPPALHALVAPGSYSLWHPSEPAAATVLGPGWRPVSVHPYATIEWMAWALGLLMLSTLAIPALQQRRLAVRAAVTVIAGGLVVAVYGIVARTVFGSLLFGRVAVPTVSPFGPFVSKNHFSGYVEMVALLAMGWALGLMKEARRDRGMLSWVGSSRAGRVLAALGVTAALALAIPVSQSRGGVLSLIAGLATFLFLVARRGEPGARSRGRWVGPGIGFLMLIIAALAVLPPEVHQRMATLTSSSPDTSGSYRLGLWRDTLRAFAASPVAGQGLGAFEDVLPRYKQQDGELRVEHAENDYLEALAEGGVLAALPLVGFLWLLFQRVPKASSHRGVEHGLRLGATAAGVALAVHSLMDFNLHIPASASLACFLLALASGGVEKRVLDVRGARALGVCGLLAIAVVAGSLSSIPPAPATPWQAGSAESGLRARHSEASLRAHIQERPSDAEAWAWLAWLRARTGARAEGASLAVHAARLDPTRSALRSFAESLDPSRAGGP